MNATAKATTAAPAAADATKNKSLYLRLAYAGRFFTKKIIKSVYFSQKPFIILMSEGNGHPNAEDSIKIPVTDSKESI